MNPNQYSQICKFSHVYKKVAYKSKTIQAEFIYFPKYINKDVKWPIDSKKIHATTNNNISKPLPILGIYSSITPFTPPLGSMPCLYP